MEESERITVTLPIPLHLFVAPTCAAVAGFISGLISSSSHASLQFLAENAHRLPTTVQGWYFYQKTKNYRVLWAGVKGGGKSAVTLGAWTAAFVGLQEGIDRQAVARLEEARPFRKTLSGSIAGIAIAAVASGLYDLGRRGQSRRLLLGISIGAVAGALEDARNYLQKAGSELEPRTELSLPA